MPEPSTTTTERASRPLSGPSVIVTPKSLPKEERNPDAVVTLSIPSAPQNRAWAKGRSSEMHSTVASGTSAAFLLKTRTLVAQVPVSRLGKMLRMSLVPFSESLVTSLRSDPTRVNAGITDPTSGSCPMV